MLGEEGARGRGRSYCSRISFGYTMKRLMEFHSRYSLLCFTVREEERFLKTTHVKGERYVKRRGT
jgi:uncharacterized protein YbgA (DUF1722 family)